MGFLSMRHKPAMPAGRMIHKSIFLKISLAAGILAVVSGLYLYGASQRSERINSSLVKDQEAYIRLAIKMQNQFGYLGDRARMPIYPLLLSLFYEPNMDPQTFFERSKRVNILLSLLILTGLFFIFKEKLGLGPGTNLLLITSFSVFMFEASNATADVLFYFLNFLSFLAMCRLLVNPSLRYGALTGLLWGISYLTKASVLAGITLFYMILALRIVSLICKAVSEKLNRRRYLRDIRTHIACGLFLTFAFFLTISPYLAQNKKIFGHYFYNVNTTFYMWYNSWNEIEKGTRAYGDRKSWPKMPPELIPSAQKYFQEHTARQVGGRIREGAWKIAKTCMKSYGYFKYILIFSFFFLFLRFFDKRHRKRSSQPRTLVLFFIFSYFTAYGLLYSWWGKLDAGDRYILTLFIPFMLMLSIAIQRETKNLSFLFYEKRIDIYTLYNYGVLIILIADLPSLIRKALTMAPL